MPDDGYEIRSPGVPDDFDLREMVGSRLEAAQVRDADGVAAQVVDVVAPVLERLRADLEDARVELTTAQGQVADYRATLKRSTEEHQATVERLRGRIAADKIHDAIAQRALAAKDEALERLRAELAEARLVAGAVADMQRLETYLAALQRAEQAEAAIADVRRLCDLTIATSCRAQAIDQAVDTLAVLDRALDASTAPESPQEDRA